MKSDMTQSGRQYLEDIFAQTANESAPAVAPGLEKLYSFKIMNKFSNASYRTQAILTQAEAWIRENTYTKFKQNSVRALINSQGLSIAAQPTGSQSKDDISHDAIPFCSMKDTGEITFTFESDAAIERLERLGFIFPNRDIIHDAMEMIAEVSKEELAKRWRPVQAIKRSPS